MYSALESNRIPHSGRRSEAALIVFQYKSLHVNGAMLVQNDPGIPYLKN
jgi:hypothetical protein